ncbi:glycosyltransferase family 39 protein [Rathayibacter sp. CAU 1779]
MATLLGILAFVVSWIGSWIPSFWGDEAASIMSAERPWTSLLAELGRVDAVHGTYYAMLHVWIDFFGAGQLSTRLPSVIAVGLATAGIVVLVERYGGLRLAATSAVIFAILPRTTYMATEVRSYAIGTACAVWLTVLFLRLVTKRTTRILPWVAFGVAYAACIYLFLYLSLIALPFAAVLLWVTRGRWSAIARAVLKPRQTASAEIALDRAVWVRWIAATIGGAILALPVIGFALKEHGQLAFLGKHPGVTFLTFTVNQWFDNDWAIAIVAWAVLLGLLVTGIVVWRRRRGSSARMLPGARSVLIVFAVACFVLPPAALLAVNSFVPAYTVRYMSFTTPALAILLAVALEGAAKWVTARWTARGRADARTGSLRPHTWRASSAAIAVAVALLAVLAYPGYLAQRGPYAKNGGSDWAEVAAVIQQNSQPGDDIAFDETTRPSRNPRLAMHLYPAQFANVVDVTLEIPYVDRDSLWDKAYTIPEVAGRLSAGNGRVWLIEYRGPDREGAVTSTGMRDRVADLRAQGFEVTQTFTLHRDVVYLFTRGTGS